MIEVIRSLIENNAIDSIVEMCKHMEPWKLQQIKKDLIQELHDTNVKNHRNTIAIVLSDLQCDEAIDVLVDLINDPQNRNSRGTFIYALQELNCEKAIKKILHVLFDGNLEVKCNMYELLLKKFNSMSENEKLECIDIVVREKERLEEELELLEDVENKIFGRRNKS
ncbi:MAG: HEAT repeat domain-containing protein [Lachnospiraceae bacterium]|nr:HEAT repeat domain-containing protein [Lachnospiraceae bacterium]